MGVKHLSTLIALSSLSFNVAWANNIIAETDTPKVVTETNDNILIGSKVPEMVTTTKDDIEKNIIVGNTNQILLNNPNKQYVLHNLIMGDSNILSPNPNNTSSLVTQKNIILGKDNNITLSNGYGAIGSSTIIGNENRLDPNNTDGRFIIMLGNKNTSISDTQTIIGNNNTANLLGVAIGYNNNAAYAGVAIGYQTKTYATKDDNAGSVAIGYASETNASYGVSIGNRSTIDAEANNSVAIGNIAKVSGANAVSLGNETSSAENGISIGSSTYANTNSVAIGNTAITESSDSVAIGSFAGVSGENAIAIGTSGVAEGQNSIALGNSASAEGEDSVAIGYSSAAPSLDDADRFGFNVITGQKYTKDNGYNYTNSGVVSFGGGDDNIIRRLTNVAAGLNDTDAVNLGQLKELMAEIKKSGDSAPTTAPTTPAADNSGLSANLNNLKNETNTALTKLGNKLDAVSNTATATANAVSEIKTNLTGKDTALAALQKDNEGIKNDLASIKDDNTSIKSDLTAVKNDNTTIKKDLNTVKDTNEAIKRDLNTVKADNESIKTDLKTVKEDNTSLHSKLDEVKKDTATALDALGNMQQASSFSKLQRSIDAVRDESNRNTSMTAALAALKPLANSETKYQVMAGFGKYRSYNAFAIGLAYADNKRSQWQTGIAFNGSHPVYNLGFSLALGKGKEKISSHTQLEQRLAKLEAENAKLHQLVAQLLAAK